MVTAKKEREMEKIQKFHPGRFYTSPSDKNWYELVERGALTLTFRVRKAKARCGSWRQTAPASFKADGKGAFETVRFSDGTVLRADSRTLPVAPAASSAA